jgi:hypothetical protein
MMRKSNEMIMFAVIAVIIVAVPISFYDLADSQPKITFITTDPAPVEFMHNITRLGSDNLSQYMVRGTSSSIISRPGYGDSYLNFTPYVSAYEIYPKVLPLICISQFLMINGSFAPGMNPSSFTVKAEFCVANNSYNHMQAIGYDMDLEERGWARNDTFEKINCNDGSQFCYLFTLQNNSQSSQRFFFGTNTTFGPIMDGGFRASFMSGLLYTVYNLTMKMTLSLTISGQTVSDQIIFYIINTGYAKQ